MERVLEKEIMDDENHIFEYANLIKDSDLSQYITNYIINNYSLDGARIIDLGSGPGDIAIKLIQKRPKIKEIIGIDASQEMISFSEKKIKAAKLSEKIKLLHVKLPDIEKKIPEKNFDIILSKHLLHHLPDPLVFWKEIKRLAKTNTKILVTDFMRPNSKKEAEKIINSFRPLKTKNTLIKFGEEDFYNSLCASFSLEEINNQLKKADLRLEIFKLKDYIFIARN